MRRLLELLALLVLLATLKQAERVQPKQDVISHPYAVPVVILIKSEFFKLKPLQLLSMMRKKGVLEVRTMLDVVFGTELGLASAPKVNSFN